jgi:orotate phosphoribosyltransferase
MAAERDLERLEKLVRLKQIVAEKALKVAKQGQEFTLSGGDKSPYYFDMRSLLSGESVSLFSDVIFDEVRKLSPEPEYIVAPGLGANTWVSAIITRAYKEGSKMTKATLVVKAKDLGDNYYQNALFGRLNTKILDDMAVVNPPLSGSMIALFDDVTTRGGSILRAFETLSKFEEFKVAGIFALLDNEKGAKEALESTFHAPFFSVFTLSDFVGEIRRKQGR